MRVAGCPREAEAVVADTAPRETHPGAVLSRLGTRRTQRAGSAPAMGRQVANLALGLPFSPQMEPPEAYQGLAEHARCRSVTAPRPHGPGHREGQEFMTRVFNENPFPGLHGEKNTKQNNSKFL